MKNNFSFNADTHNFWPIYEAIKHFYPIGITGNYPSLFFEYPNLKTLGNKVVDSIHNEANFSLWKAFEKQISHNHNLEVVGTTYGQAPSLSFDVILEKVESPEFRRIKKISVAVSLVGGFFTIYGVDETFVIEKNQGSLDLNYHSINVITVSPYKEFESIFIDLKIAVEAKFKGYKFVPYAIGNMTLKGLQVRYIDYNGDSSIYNALFDQFLDSYDGPVRGSKFFGYEDWSIDLSNPDSVGVFTTPPPQL
ncbi:hypothetical protein ACFOG5_03840 [Pedobacter fastidiosus]|uniref:Uncharacterized protein n=1 Tax=Pedobacter fastidiosus TaxID=2765361 RepID=A0ABR7KMU2_9SPHI|nr:hypothetical protein [Pedobacter fastidiosus]MBC6109392.1 hypothetical protein [Pedobacter fastidiosus]